LSAKEYREKTRKIVKTPSGFEFTIKKLPLKTVTELFEIFGTTEITDVMIMSDPEVRKSLAMAVEKVLTAGVVKPKIVLHATNEDELSIEELEASDGLHLFRCILEFSGLSEEKAKERASFRTESVR